VSDSSVTELEEIFLQEATDLVAGLSRGLLDLEEPASPERRKEHLDHIFRLTHTLKGSSQTIERNDMGDVAHALESVLDGIRRGHLQPSREMTDAALAVVDLLTAATARPLTPAEVSQARLSLAKWLSEDEAKPAPEAPAEPAQAAEPQAASAEAQATVRVPVALLDSLLYRIDELVGTKLRLDYQRKQVEEMQVALDGAASRELASPGAFVAQAQLERRSLELLRAHLAQEAHGLGMLAYTLQDSVRQVRMVSLNLDHLRRSVRDLCTTLGKEGVLEITGEQVRVDRRLPELLRDPLLHLLRNSLDHGIESPAERAAAGKPARGKIQIQISSRDGHVLLRVKDDGRGIDRERVKAVALERGIIDAARAEQMAPHEVVDLIFGAGFSTAPAVTETSGRGVGLDVVRENVQQLGGHVEVRSEAGHGTEFLLSMPLSLATSRGLLVEVGTDVYCLPLEAVEEVIAYQASDLGVSQGRFVLQRRGQPLVFAPLATLLAAGTAAPAKHGGYAIVLSVLERRVALGAERLLGQEETVVKSLAPGTPRLEFVSGATTLADGRVATLLEPIALVEATLRSTAAGAAADRGTVLVADDSLTSRALMAATLERAGYRTLVECDAPAALATLQRERVDLVISDVEMPGAIDGIGLVREIRGNARLRHTPVILVTSLGAAEDRARGAQAGANAYVVKKDFDPVHLVQLVADYLEAG
jgi:two-component system chemotaxis sensor kinase CheA